MADPWKTVPFGGHLVAVNTAEEPAKAWRTLKGWTQLCGPAPGKIIDAKWFDGVLGWRMIALTDEGVFELDGSAWKKVEATNG